jgi:hypothetical protein
MLGFPCGIFWAVLGGHAYTLSTAIWDIEYLIFFSSMGMLIFCIFAAYGLRTKKEDLDEGDEYIDEGKDDLKFIDEGSKGDTANRDSAEEDKPRRSTREIRERANRRRARWD